MSMDSFLSLFGPSADDDIHMEPIDPSAASAAADASSTSGTSSSTSDTPNHHQRTSPNDQHSSATSPPTMNFASGRLPPEPQLGNIEYKLKLINPTPQRFEHLVTQMKWRLREGNGEAIYEIGVSDSGHLHGLNEAEMTASLNTLRQMSAQLGATTTVLRRQSVAATQRRRAVAAPAAAAAASADSLSVAEVLVRKVPDDQHSIEVRMAVLGGAGAGKSTLLGVLTQGERDNGRGRARLNMFRHMHEIRSGRTSCISHETLAFDHQGTVLNYGGGGGGGAGGAGVAANGGSELLSNAEQAISERASKLVTFMDLAGHRRYMRTTVQALTGYGPHQAMLVVDSGPEDAVGSIASMANEHLDLVLALGMPFFVVVTKTDAAPPGATLRRLGAMLTAAGCRRAPLPVQTEDDVLTAATRQLGSQVVPIFCVSCVTGAGMDLLTRFLFVVPPGVSTAERERLEREPAEFHVDEVFRVAGVGGGHVIGGLLVSGILAGCNGEQPMRLGPLADGRFVAVRVRSMHRNKAPCRAVRAGQSASLALDWDVRNRPDEPADLSAVIRSGMVLMESADTSAEEAAAAEAAAAEPFGSLFFQAKISVLHHATAIYEGFQTTVHIGSVRQTAVIEGIMGREKMQTNDTASVLFRFVCHPEYVRPGQRVLFREGTSKGVGHVTQVFPLNQSET